jgi:hypothetical protein
VAVALRMLPVGEEALRNDEIQIVLRASHRNVQKSAFFLDLLNGTGPRSDGMQPSTTLSTNTDFHSCPLAEWIVDKIR